MATVDIAQKLASLQYAPFVPTDARDESIAARLPQTIGRAVSGDYLEFLRAYPNTGMFDIEGGVIARGIERLSGIHDGRYSVSMLYAFCSDRRYDVIAIATAPYYEGESIPRYLLQVGDDLFGNAFCLDLRPESFGRVYFWEHEHAQRESGLHLMSEDFGSFINSLEAAP